MNLTFREAEWYPVSQKQHPTDNFRAQYISTQTHISIFITKNQITILGTEVTNTKPYFYIHNQQSNYILIKGKYKVWTSSLDGEQ